eukprot:CAMPEP_0204281644 /NCGR_PEP_ID=MMETSP0468-20130131/41424_1 /ASSEMBLY_ACC=CAM_ASM_000383 /TAXON_ID=2969 /ORGANISM="Oxyrrhis marina" /LENGTH=62 /DNA_ID=CAMNT_0051259029 /DNA_START=267 /DNA_END=455 /DNA_ORIENTATION=+
MLIIRADAIWRIGRGADGQIELLPAPTPVVELSELPGLEIVQQAGRHIEESGNADNMDLSIA